MDTKFLTQMLEHIRINDALPENAFMILGRGNAVLYRNGEAHHFQWNGVEIEGGNVRPLNLRKVSRERG